MTPSIALLDTSALILLGTLPDPKALPAQLRISAVTLAELSVGPLVATSDAERTARQLHLQLAEADFDAIPFDSSAARAFGGVAASLRSQGRKPTARSYDAMIAATAIAHQLPLATFNSRDFTGIDGLTMLDLAVLVR